VVLSLWEVDDPSTALLMTRFYQNLLGKRSDLAKPLPKAEALREAKQWLRALPWAECKRLTAALSPGESRGPVVKRDKPVVPPSGSAEHDKPPYADPYYWAAFILLGDPE
jgi:CHAT domain-containing protein